VSDDAEITANVSATQLQSLFDPRQHVRAAALLVDQALLAAERAVSSLPREAVSCPSQS